MAITQREQTEITGANAAARNAVVFVHGLWLLPSSWDRWRTAFDEAGYATLAPGWPDDPETVAEARQHPEVFANKSIKEVADHFDGVIHQLTKKPAVVGHSFGGLLTQILAGRSLSAASVAIDPAPFRGVLPLPISALRSASPSLSRRSRPNRGQSSPSRASPAPRPTSSSAAKRRSRWPVSARARSAPASRSARWRSSTTGRASVRSGRSRR